MMGQGMGRWAWETDIGTGPQNGAKTRHGDVAKARHGNRAKARHGDGHDGSNKDNI